MPKAHARRCWLVVPAVASLVWRAAAAHAVTDLSLVLTAGGLPEAGCHEAGQEVLVRIELGPTKVDIAGGQFLIRYDPACLSFASIVPGQACDPSSTMVNTIFQSVDEAKGWIFYAVGVAPVGPALPGPVTFACLTFIKTEDCTACEVCFDSENPQNTIVSDDTGHPVPFAPHCTDVIRTASEVTAACPADVSAQLTCGQPAASVGWAAPQFEDGCEGLVDYDCFATDGDDVRTALVEPDAGEFSIGLSTVCCAGTNSCGISHECCWSVTVAGPSDADCADGDSCTVDSCTPDDPNAASDGCLHTRLVILYGDMVPAGGDGLVDLDELVCVIFGFARLEDCPAGDIAPCGGDGVIDVDDIGAVVQTFGGAAPCPDPCPP
jgi:hypothetical protein